MYLYHPVSAWQGIPPENYFIVAGDRTPQLGTGYVNTFEQPEMYPDIPLHQLLYMDAQPAARNLLFGALLGRAEQLRAGRPEGARARMFTQLSPENRDAAAFFQQLGFRMDDQEELCRFSLPDWPGRTLASCSYNSVSLRTPEEIAGFTTRLNQYRLTPLTPDFLTQCMATEHFLAVGFYRGAKPVCEALFAGEGPVVSLVSLYVRSDFRRQGMAKAMIGCACDYFKPRGVTVMNTHVYTRNPAQIGLVRSARAQRVRVLALLPGMYV